MFLSSAVSLIIGESCMT